MNKIVFLVSGNGGNLKFIHHYIKDSQDSDFVIASVIADRKCKALEFARSNSIDNHLIEYTKENPLELLQKLNAIEPDMIITNFHKILDERILKQFSNVLINLHYSILPAFKGLIGTAPIDEALSKNCRFIGTTTHFLEKAVDEGKIICQSAFAVPQNPDRESLIEHVFRTGCLVLLNTLYVLSGKEMKINHSVYEDTLYSSLISPGLTFEVNDIHSDIWKKIAN